MLFVTQDNPAGALPGWLVNFAAKKAVPSWMKKYKKAATEQMRKQGLL